MLAVGELLHTAILPIDGQQVEGEETRFTSTEQQILELRPALLVHTNDLAVQHGQVRVVYTAPMLLASSANEANGLPLREINWARACSITARARKPSYFSSKSQLGSSNGEGRFCSGIGWNRP